MEILPIKKDIIIQEKGFRFVGKPNFHFWAAALIGAWPIIFLFEVCRYHEYIYYFAPAFHIWHFVALVWYLNIFDKSENIALYGLIICSVCFLGLHFQKKLSL